MPAPRTTSTAPAGRAAARAALGAACFAVVLLAVCAVQAGEPPRRIVSLNPSLTAILVELGVADRLVGIDSFSHRQQAALAALPDVGGLFDASLESIVALAPELVVLVPSVEQRDLRSRLEALGLRVVAFPNIRFDDVLANIVDLGRLVGREQAAKTRIAAIGRTRAAVRQVAAARDPARCLVVLQRDPLFVVGPGSFLDEMLRDAGGKNLAAALGDPYPRVGLEWLVAAAPEVIVDMSLDAGADAAVLEYWKRWPTLPAVAAERVLHIEPELVTMPGPQLDRALRVLVRALHGEGVVSELARVEAERSREGAHEDGP